MLLTVHTMRELDFRALMNIYAEGNAENGAELYPAVPKAQQVLMAEQDFYQYLRECFFPTSGAVYYIWEESGNYVSALRLEPYRDGLLLEALETMPTCRNKGYATTLIREVLKHRPEKMYSHISKRNPSSIRTHEKCGFRRISDHAVYADGSVSVRAYTYCR